MRSVVEIALYYSWQKSKTWTSAACKNKLQSCRHNRDECESRSQVTDKPTYNKTPIKAKFMLLIPWICSLF